MTTRTEILPGQRAQYRKVGKVEIIRCVTAGLYEVRFLTGPRSYKEGTHRVWLTAEDVLW